MSRVAGVVVAACLAGLPVLAGQQLPDALLRAAFLLNFARYTEWPAAALAPGAAVAICVDDEAVFTALRDAVDGKSIGDRAVTAQRLLAATGAERCHVAYLRKVTASDATRLFPALADAHVFVVVDDAVAWRAGAVAHVFAEGRRLRFAISLPHARRAGLQLSSRLLSVAVVHRTPDADPRR
jgi:hypothetical protein